MRKPGLPPITDEKTEIIILGTLPSDKSLADGQYYANPSNDFWKLVGAAINQNFQGLLYGDKLNLLHAHRIGLWDAYHSCFRPGSMDKDIAQTEPNDFAILKKIAPSIKSVCFNGKRAADVEKSVLGLGYQTYRLPSSSGANRRDQDGRLTLWKAAISMRATGE